MSVPILLWVGSTQVGKSSAIKLLTDDNQIVCGEYGIGSSTTYQIKIHHENVHRLGKAYLHMDTIGLGDNRLQYDDNEIMKKIEIEILKKSDSMSVNEVPAIIATESFQGDAYRLPQVFLQIRRMFNFFPSESIIILATKRNTAGPQLYEKRKKQLKQLMRIYNIPESRYLEFDTPCEAAGFPQDRISFSQFYQLSARIEQCKPLKLDRIKEKQAMLQKRAEQILKQLTRVEEFTYQTDRVTMRTETRTQNIQIPVQNHQTNIFGRIGGAIGGFILGGPIGGALGSELGSIFDRPRAGTQNYSFQHQIQVPEIHQEQQTRQIENRPDMEYCYRLALEEFDKECRNQMIKK